ncbi:hypothetical protein Q8A73_012757 [Channa argus]|nr:hypothetical protein Q8A73_012757 [Channa argus]
MTSLKTWCLLSLSVLLLLSIAPTGTEVVQSMSDCEGFLLNENPPQIPGILINGNIQDQKRYKIICQTYKNQTRFVTLYDTNNKIPVFSAYKYRGEGPLDEDMKRQNVPWKIEPQLEERDSMSNMWDDVYKNQAKELQVSTPSPNHNCPSYYSFNYCCCHCEHHYIYDHSPNSYSFNYCCCHFEHQYIYDHSPSNYSFNYCCCHFEHQYIYDHSPSYYSFNYCCCHFEHQYIYDHSPNNYYFYKSY